VYWHHHGADSTAGGAARRRLIYGVESLSVAIVRLCRAHVLTSSSATRDYLVGRGIAPNKVALTVNATSFGVNGRAGEHLEVNVPALNRFEGQRFVLFCGRLSRQKGSADLTHVIARLHADDPHLMFAICGDGPDRSKLEADLAALIQSGHVTVFGYVAEPIKLWLLQHAHVLVFPSYEEGWGITVHEALLSGCWVVAYDLEAVRSTCPDGPLFSPVGDVQRVAEDSKACLDRPRPAPAMEPNAEWDVIADAELQRMRMWAAA
jgi:glycosyltransferase involved in cell wall biosynthesis